MVAMDKTTAQAIHDLATSGRLGEESAEAVADALGLNEEPEDDAAAEAEPEPAKSASKSAAQGKR